TDEQRTPLEVCLDKSAPALKLLHQASRMEQCQFDLDYRWGPAMFTPHTESLREAVRLERTAMLVSLRAGQTEQAFERWLDSVGIVRHQEGQNVLISELVRSACLSISLDAVQALVQSGELTDAQLSRALAGLDGIEGRNSFTDCLKGELVSFRQCYRLGFGQVFPGSGGSPVPGHSLVIGVFRPLFQHDEATGVRLVSELIDLSMQPHYQVRQQVAQWGRSLSVRPWLTPLTAMVLPYLYNTLDLVAYAEASAALARTRLALELYRLSRGDYPDALSDLAPDFLPQIPLDPFDGKPLRYIKSAERVAVYSLGRDLQDDGGSEERGTSRRAKDIVFTVRRGPEQGGEEGPPP
ncbi:MAG: hypothetical protein KAX80_05675, partial [Planctomycetes bacterium]|nr:hypothetical protein [Planctomycetota bacterium]